MKNYLMFALLIGAISFAAFGQIGVADPAKVTVNCPDDECHVAPFFKGEGGFVGEIADGFDEVNFVVDCGLVSTSATAAPSGGIVAQRLGMDNGLACASGGSVEVHGLKDGGWYWITGADSSGVASLVAKDALGNDMVKPANPGGGVTMESLADGATTLLTEGSSGRIGILHHVLPEPMMADLSPCAPYWDGDDRTYYPGENDCALGDGGTEIVLWLPTDNRGRGAAVEGVVHRPADDNDLEIDLQLWGNGTGHIAPGSGAAALRGWNISTPSGRPKPSPFDANYSVITLSGTTFDATQAGITIEPGGMGSRMTMEAVAPVDHDPTTAWLDAGHSDNDGTPDCQQDRRDPQAGTVGLATQIAFMGASAGNPTVWIPSDNDSGGSEIGAAASDSDAATWAAAYNTAAGAATPADPLIEVFEHPGPDGDATATGDNIADVPVVVCQMEEVESTVDVDATLRIESSSSYCGSGRNVSADVLIYAPSGDARALNDDIVPTLARTWVPGLGFQAATTTLRVMCP